MKLPRSLRTPLLPAVIRKPLRKLFRQPALLRDYFAVGAGTYGEPVVHFRKCAQLRIGAYCSIGGEVIDRTSLFQCRGRAPDKFTVKRRFRAIR